MKTIIGYKIQEAADLLSNGELISIPTETVYGLAANAFDQRAVNKIFEVKGRPKNNPLILHVDSILKINDLVDSIPDNALKLSEHFWPGPLTMVLPKSSKVSKEVTGGLNTVAVRIPDHQICLELLGKLSFPLAAPSANPFMYISPTKPEHVYQQLNGKIPYILNGGKCKAGLESTIVKFIDNKVQLLRHGSVSIEAIEKVIGSDLLVSSNSDDIEAPGMFKKHYSPKTKLILSDNIHLAIKENSNKKLAVLSFMDIESNLDFPSIILSSKGDLREAAFNLFDALHQLDDISPDLIIAEKLPDEGLGRTINDRLSRASSNS